MPAIEFTNAALKDYRKLPHDMMDRVTRAVDALEGDPLPPGCRKLKGETTLYRVRVGTYRIIYDYLEGGETVTITRIRHRKSAYR